MSRIETDIVIIGAGLTGLTAAFHLRQKGKKVLVLEKENRPGGQIQTYREDGFVFESGPNTGAVSHPEVAELFQLLSPDCELEIANEEAKRRLIWKGDRFHELPCNMIGGLTTPLFSFYDKMRIWGEPFRSKGCDPDESVGELVRRRLGKSYLDYAVDPFISGVYAGDPMALTTRFALPKLYNLEQQYGSFIKGAIGKSKEPKTDRDRQATKQVFSARGGLSNLVEGLAKQIGPENIWLSAKNIEIRPLESAWSVRYHSDGEDMNVVAGQVITTTGAYTLSSLLPFIPAKELNPVTRLMYAPVMQVSVGIKNTSKLRFNAFGGLIPSCEQKDILGILFPSACFSGRSPEEGAVFSFFMGGVKHPELLQKTDDEVRSIINTALVDLLKLPAGTEPDMLRIFRHTHAIPQYRKDSGERFDAIEKLEKKYSGLIIAGNVRNGIGMADRIKQATNLGFISPDR